jgi:hypothetical protein
MKIGQPLAVDEAARPPAVLPCQRPTRRAFALWKSVSAPRYEAVVISAVSCSLITSS